MEKNYNKVFRCLQCIEKLYHGGRMELYKLTQVQWHPIFAFSSVGASVCHILDHPVTLQITLIQLEPNGRLGIHPTMADQLFLVLEGQGTVSTQVSTPEPVHNGSLIFWKRGEVHEVRSSPSGMKALALEGDGIQLLLERNHSQV
jgi:quercetin dioxygenase-like cupin family protein